MTVPADVIAEMAGLGIGEPCPQKRNGSNGGSIADVTLEEIEAKRRRVAEIAKMADTMSRLVLEVRETTRELNETLTRISAEITSFGENDDA